jgi:hypothetical protein
LGALVTYILIHVAALALVFAGAAGAGTLAARSEPSLAFRCALGLAIWAHALFALALAGQLRAIPVALLFAASLWFCRVRGRPTPAILWLALPFLMALRPPLAFDETLYHLPFVQALARSGQLRFVATMRFPAFPQLHELLCVPLFWFAGDVATHLVSLAEVAITAALLVDWGRRYHRSAGTLAAGIFLGSPIVVQLATITYVDAALALFVTAGFYCLDRARSEGRTWFAFSGLFFGTACSVKYLGLTFAAAALAITLFSSRDRRRAALTFAACCAAAMLPTTLWLVATTRNPVFPFIPHVFGETVWSMALPHVPFAQRVIRTLTLPWNVTAARARVNWQPPVTPLLMPGLIVLAAAAARDVRARAVAFVIALHVAVFAFLPQDSRYLVALLPLISIVCAVSAAPRSRWLAAAAIAPAIAYAVYSLAARGLPPVTAESRERMLTERVPEYAALMRAGNGRVYGCGGEQLKYYARGELLGDLTGPFSYGRILGGDVAANLRRINADYLLVSKRVCPPRRRDGGMMLVFEDSAAQLWRVQRSESSQSRHLR